MPGRFQLACLAAALLSLLPYAADMFGLPLPVALRLLLLPLSEGPHYMGILFHESAHALSHWLFGEPALPLFDATEGGGVTYYYGRSRALTAGVYVLMGAGLLLLYRARRFRAAAVLALFIPLHALLVAGGMDIFVTMMAGNAVEAAVGAALVTLALARPDILKSRAERAVALVAGTHLFCRKLLLCLGLMLVEVRRREYAVQKAAGVGGDLHEAAIVVGATVEQVAAALLLFILACGIFCAVYIARHRR